MKTMKLTLGMLAVVALAFNASAGVTSAYYGDYTGSTVDFLNVQEHTTSPGDTVPKYGAPFVLGDTMDFTPIGFIAQTSSQVPSDTTDGQLAFWVDAHEGMGVAQIGFSEKGDFSVTGPDTAQAFVDVSATFYIDIYEVNNVLLSEKISIVETMDFDMSSTARDDGTHDLVADGEEYNGLWSGRLVVDLSAYLAGLDEFNEFDEATLVSVSLDNTLNAEASSGANATIAKKDFTSHGMSVEIIPEPASLGLILGAASIIVYARRRFVA